MPHRFTKGKLSAAVMCAVVLLGAGLSGCNDNKPTSKLLQDAQQYQQKGDHKAALIQLKNAVAQSPEDGEARLRLGELHLDMGDSASAEKELRKAASLGAPPQRTLPLLARLMLSQGQYKQLLDEITPQAAQGSAQLLAMRGDAFVALGDPVHAKQAYEQALAVDQHAGDALTGLARNAIAQGDRQAGERYTADAIARDPGNPEVWMFNGTMLRAAGKPAEALAAFDKALALKPEHRSAHVEKAYIEIEQGKFDAAKADLDAARKNAPGSLLVTYSQAMLDFSQGKFAAAQESLQKVLKSAPEHMPSILLAGAVELNMGATQQAEQHLRKYLGINPDNLYARKLLAQTLLKSGQPNDAVAALAPVLKQAPQDAQLLALAGESYMQVHDFNQASAYFEKAAALAPKAAVVHTSLGLARLNQGEHDKAISELQLATELDPASASAGFALVQAQVSARQYDKALATVDKLAQRQPGNAAVQNLKGGVYLAKGDKAAARAAFDKALSLQPNYFTAVANLAQLDLADNQPDAARARFEAFLQKEPKNFGAMAALAELLAAQDKPAEATAWLEKASNANPDAVGPALKLGAQYLRTRQPQKALTLARKFQTANPTNPDVLDLLGQSQLANKDQAGALETYSKLANVLPKSAMAQMRMASVHALMKNDSAAAEDLRRAAELQPDLVDARVAQVELAMRRGRVDEALAAARQVQKRPAQATLGYMLEGDIHLSQNKAPLALAAYQKAYATTPTPQLLVKVAQVLKLTGKEKESEQLIGQWRRAHPDEPVVALYVAESQLANKQFKPAIALLEQVVKNDPKHAVALNNLAWAYQQEKDPRALATAEQALKLTGDSPAVMDTLGWMLVEQGNTQRGVPLLQKAVALAPAAADIRYHLAFGLSKAGDKDGARKELDKLLGENRPFAQLDEARSLRKML
ncbi:PEP-CTERM system TPR-repeat protein PrsT [Massilia agilis]|uniref:PEP-CTERM system TPR-repeat protein PrsT n=1 Tax=Massilia agilis TaxID=1811226 RepID=A0ABT2DFG8_9BURK|nr:XrtA/PEP-CTERM system TPR-repeat protein PrsT [Massilia agilis]MCS0809166.1 PEP-CTERM system TPR-repeat protein PrsT [Massilia agilis]